MGFSYFVLGLATLLLSAFTPLPRLRTVQSGVPKAAAARTELLRHGDAVGGVRAAPGAGAPTRTRPCGGIYGGGGGGDVRARGQENQAREAVQGLLRQRTAQAGEED